MLYSVAVQGSTLAGAGPMSAFVTESYASVTSMTYAHDTSTSPTPGDRLYAFFKTHSIAPQARFGDQLAFRALICTAVDLE